MLGEFDIGRFKSLRGSKPLNQKPVLIFTWGTFTTQKDQSVSPSNFLPPLLTFFSPFSSTKLKIIQPTTGKSSSSSPPAPKLPGVYHHQQHGSDQCGGTFKCTPLFIIYHLCRHVIRMKVNSHLHLTAAMATTWQ